MTSITYPHCRAFSANVSHLLSPSLVWRLCLSQYAQTSKCEESRQLLCASNVHPLHLHDMPHAKVHAEGCSIFRLTLPLPLCTTSILHKLRILNAAEFPCTAIQQSDPKLCAATSPCVPPLGLEPPRSKGRFIFNFNQLGVSLLRVPFLVSKRNQKEDHLLCPAK